MKNTLIYLIVSAAVLAGCQKDDPDPVIPQPETTLRLDLRALYEGELLQAGQVYQNITDYRVQVNELKLYLSHIYAVRSSGDTVSLKDIAFFNLTSGADGISLGTVPAGSYTSFGFGLGVPAEMNSPLNPDFSIAIFQPGHPLSEANGMYWTWATGYRFVIFDGRYDTDSEATSDLINGFSFHTGKDESYRNLVFSEAFNVAEGNEHKIRLDFEVDRFFYSQADTLDVAVNNQAHGTNQVLSDRVSDLVTNAIVLN